MKKILITGGTTFVSKYVAEYFVNMEKIIINKPTEHIFNVGNSEGLSIKDWVIKCYDCFGKVPAFKNVYDDIEQRNYFSFYDYEYYLNVQRQHNMYHDTISIDEGLKECAKWYLEHQIDVKKKPFLEYIDSKLKVCEEKSVNTNLL